MDRVKVKAFATLRRYVQGLGIGLGVPHEEVRVVYVNNVCRDLSHRLVDGDQVGIFPAVGGG